MKRVAVYCGSSPGRTPAYREAARSLAESLVERGLGLVYGGGKVGLMGVLADAVLEAKGEVIGVIPRGLYEREVAHLGLSELKIVETMHERKALMFEHADAFVALPGGFGTLDEMVEMLTWSQLGLHARPCGLLDVDGFYADFLRFLDRAVAERFIAEPHRGLLLMETDPGRLLDRFATFEPPLLEKWLDRDDV